MLDEPDTSLHARLATLVGATHVITHAPDMAAWLTEPRDLFHGRAACVVRPGSTAEVAAVLRLCHETNTKIVPQGGNTGLVGGQSPDGSGEQIILSLTRMDRLRELDVSSNTMTVEAGMTLLCVQDIAEQADRLFPLSLASEGSCTIGALDLCQLAQTMAGTDVKTFELVPRIGIDYALKHGAKTREPLASTHDWYVLIELASQAEAGTRLLGLLEVALSDGLIENATLAGSLEQARDFWRLRELMSDVQKLEGGSIKHDVSVPVARVPDFIAAAGAAIAQAMPGARPVPFGHLGDGNIHYNISQPVGADKQAFLARWDEANAIVHAIVAQMGGSISAEHGIGVLKRDLLPGVKDAVALDVMRAIKIALDPRGILNPGKVLPP